MALRKIDWERQIGRRLKLRDLHIFSTVVQRGSMAQAAAHLGVSQPSVSAVIADLEYTLGVKLFDRRSRGIEPTLYGHTLFKRSLAAFDELKQGIREIEFLGDPTIGEVSIGCAESMAAAILPPVIARFHQQYPRIVVHVNDVVAPTLEVPALRERSLDLVLARFKRPLASQDEDLNVEILLHDEMLVTAGLQSRWATRRKIDLSELVDEPWILPPAQSWNYMNIMEAFQARGLPMPSIALMTFSVHLRSNLLASGPYITAFPKSVLRLNADRFALKILPVDLVVRPWPVALVTLKNRTLNPIAQLFMDHLRAFAASIAPQLRLVRK